MTCHVTGWKLGTGLPDSVVLVLHCVPPGQTTSEPALQDRHRGVLGQHSLHRQQQSIHHTFLLTHAAALHDQKYQSDQLERGGGGEEEGGGRREG